MSSWTRGTSGWCRRGPWGVGGEGEEGEEEEEGERGGHLPGVLLFHSREEAEAHRREALEKGDDGDDGDDEWGMDENKGEGGDKGAEEGGDKGGEKGAAQNKGAPRQSPTT